MPVVSARLVNPAKWLRPGGRRLHRSWTLGIAGIGLLYALYFFTIHWWSGQVLDSAFHAPGRPRKSTHITTASTSTSSSRSIMVLYVFSYTDPEYLNNLRYFIREAVSGDTHSDYFIAVQNVSSVQDVDLPQLPNHAKYIPHENECYDWGTFGWLLLSSGQADYKRYKHYMFINSSVRGPYLPSYARGVLHWTDPFLQRLSPRVKLVGSTISCEGSPMDGDMEGTWRRNPHVQSYAVGTDRVGLEVLIKNRQVFGCHRDRWAAIYHSELGSSAAILNAGYSIDCLMIRYQGVNWRSRKLWDCNARLTPTGEWFNDGISLDPLEVMFVKLKSHMLDSDHSASKKAVRYETWQQQQQQQVRPQLNLTSLSANEYLMDMARYKTPHVLEVRARGPRCFDYDYYIMNNPDLGKEAASQEALWKYYVYYGQFEARPFRFTCDLDYERLTTW